MKAVLNRWRTVRFDEIAQSITDRVDDPSAAGVERYVGLEHLDRDSLRIARWGAPTDVEATKLRFSTGDVIFGRRRSYQRKVAVADFDGICSAHALVLRAKPNVVLPEFLPLFIQSDLFFDRALSISVGSLSPTINWKSLAKQEFELPALEDQKRCADLLWAAESVVERLKGLVATAETLRRALISHRLHGGVDRQPEEPNSLIGAVPRHWDICRVRDVGELRLGRQRAPKYQSGRFSRPYLRVANVFDGYLDTSNVLSMDFDAQDYERYRLESGDILLNEGQSRELVGRSCIYGGEIRGCCYQNTLIRFRPHPRVTSEFAHIYFQNLYYAGGFASIASQTTSMAHLGLERLASLPFPVPPAEEQARIVADVAHVTSVITRCGHHLSTTRELKKQLLGTVLNAG